MNNSWFFDENFNGVPDDFFDDAIKYFDFPLEDVEPHDDGDDWEAKFQHLEPPPSLVGFTDSGNSNETLKLNKNSSVLDDGSSQLNQWPTTAEVLSTRAIPRQYDSSERKYSHPFRTSSPVSVLESSGSSCSAENSKSYFPIFVAPPKRPRSKRPRPPRHTFPFISTYATRNFHSLATSESESESYLDEKLSNAKKKQKKKRNLTLLSCTVEVKQPSSEKPAEIRQCSHCAVTKTPQWREGPNGPKTLCNACGVRYRSGRLLPEYRPAASPTFVPSIHSNSHRKVLEMRKTGQTTAMAPRDSKMPTAADVKVPTSMDGKLPKAPEYSF
ncbi:hypothetical protein Tsubulata_016833 [Turnera subulata]|uniref:GATA-type domain-containing protein n=1 Tax=Turnera subulata TaxID=218843 RepID=A0A9Q0F861_9ROSI|nr:hypothetical protein Tsubulata_016833 [Turnera subulata]